MREEIIIEGGSMGNSSGNDGEIMGDQVHQRPIIERPVVREASRLSIPRPYESNRHDDLPPPPPLQHHPPSEGRRSSGFVTLTTDQIRSDKLPPLPPLEHHPIQDNLIALSYEGEPSWFGGSPLVRKWKLVWVCRACDFKTFTAGNFRAHKRKAHDPNSVFECYYCPCRFRLRQLLFTHMSSKHSSHPEQGPMLHQRADKPKLLKTKPALYKVVGKHFKCTKCPYIAVKQSAIKIHTKTAHNLSNMHCCSFCSCRYRSPGRLTHHIRFQHSWAEKISSDKRKKARWNIPQSHKV